MKLQMPSTMTIADIFRLAVDAEETGQLFYEALGACCGNPHVSDLCHRMVIQEAEHRRKFEKMHQEYSRNVRAYHSHGGKTHWDEDIENRSTCDGEYIQRLINERIIPAPGEARAVARQGSLRKALEMAIKMERDSIALYEEMLEGASPAHVQVLKEIIEEERQHVHDLLSGSMIL